MQQAVIADDLGDVEAQAQALGAVFLRVAAAAGQRDRAGI